MSVAEKLIEGSVQKARWLRKQQTSPEKVLWRLLRNRRFHTLKFRRQVPIGPYVVDFICPQKKFVIELDGGVHAYKKNGDRKRDAILRKKGLSVLRFTNTQLRESPILVLETITKAICPPLPPGEG